MNSRTMGRSANGQTGPGNDIERAAEFLGIPVAEAIELGQHANDYAYSVLGRRTDEAALDEMYRRSARHYLCRYSLPATSEWWREFNAGIDNLSRALDYGCGVAKPFQALIGEGYDLTLADVPSTIFDFLKWRFGNSAKYLEIGGRFPLTETYTHVICTNVLEHVSFPVELFEHLTAHLESGGHLLFFFDTNPDRPGHLPESIARKAAVDALIRKHYVRHKVCDRGRLWLVKR